MTPTLYYIHDPMCSWCWGFRPIWLELEDALVKQSINVVYVLGGLAQDTELTMPVSQQQAIQQHWLKIQQLLGTSFNFDFWRFNTPRRATFAACRAVLSAKRLGEEYKTGYGAALEKAMILGIQTAYYLEAKNPSDDAVLEGVFEQIVGDFSEIPVAPACKQFQAYLNHPDTQQALELEISLSRSLSHQGFPSLVLTQDDRSSIIAIDYQSSNNMMDHIHAALTL